MTIDPSNERMDVFILVSVLDLGQTHPRRTITDSDGREREREREKSIILYLLSSCEEYIVDTAADCNTRNLAISEGGKVSEGRFASILNLRLPACDQGNSEKRAPPSGILLEGKSINGQLLSRMINTSSGGERIYRTGVAPPINGERFLDPPANVIIEYRAKKNML